MVLDRDRWITEIVAHLFLGSQNKAHYRRNNNINFFKTSSNDGFFVEFFCPDEKLVLNTHS